MKWTLDTDAKAFYFYLAEGTCSRQKIGRASICDLDTAGVPVGVEVLLPVDIRQLRVDLLDCGVSEQEVSRVVSVILQITPSNLTIAGGQHGTQTRTTVANVASDTYLVPA